MDLGGGTDGRIGMVSQARPSCSLTLIAIGTEEQKKKLCDTRAQKEWHV